MQLSSVPDLERLRWQQRVVVMVADTANDAKLVEQDKIAAEQAAGFDERDIKTFRVVGSAAEAQKLRERLRVARQGFAVVLIGKDGYVKLRRTEPLSAEDLFRVIDSMPMRRDEMKERKPSEHE